jgi:arylsulfatase A-like enzyme
VQDYWNHTFPTGQCKKVNATGRCDGLCAIDFNNNSGAHGDLQVLGASFQGKYSARVFSTEAVREIEQHASESLERGFFLYLAMQSVHGPWEAPDESVAVFSDPTAPDRFINDTLRQVYAGMLLELDYAVGNVTAALKNAEMWHDRTLLVLTSDNGVPGRVEHHQITCLLGLSLASPALRCVPAPSECTAPWFCLSLIACLCVVCRGGKATLWYEHTTLGYRTAVVKIKWII